MPAERAIGFATEDFRILVYCDRRERVSDVVLDGKCERRRIKDSIAATGMVRRGSEERREWYFETMLVRMVSKNA